MGSSNESFGTFLTSIGPLGSRSSSVSGLDGAAPVEGPAVARPTDAILAIATAILEEGGGKPVQLPTLIERTGLSKTEFLDAMLRGRDAGILSVERNQSELGLTALGAALAKS